MEKDISNSVAPKTRACIALFDDNDDLLGLMQDILNDEGYEVDAMNETSSAHAYIKETKPDLIILDMGIEYPDTGRHLLEAIRSDPQTAHTPVIMCSGASDLLHQQKKQLERLNCHILEKPFDINEFLEMVQLTLSETNQIESGPSLSC